MAGKLTVPTISVTEAAAALGLSSRDRALQLVRLLDIGTQTHFGAHGGNKWRFYPDAVARLAATGLVRAPDPTHQFGPRPGPPIISTYETALLNQQVI
jgi:hypothetical protein